MIRDIGLSAPIPIYYPPVQVREEPKEEPEEEPIEGPQQSIIEEFMEELRSIQERSGD